MTNCVKPLKTITRMLNKSKEKIIPNIKTKQTSTDFNPTVFQLNESSVSAEDDRLNS
jgi:hypothetical protein